MEGVNTKEKELMDMDNSVVIEGVGNEWRWKRVWGDKW